MRTAMDLPKEILKRELKNTEGNLFDESLISGIFENNGYSGNYSYLIKELLNEGFLFECTGNRYIYNNAVDGDRIKKEIHYGKNY